MLGLGDFADPFTDSGAIATWADLGSQAGSDAITFSADAPDGTSTAVPGVAITGSPSADHYGAWGEYGAVLLSDFDASVSGGAQDIPFTGHVTGPPPYILADAAGTNSADSRSATWTGIAEAASARAFRRRQGAATLNIADLSSPRVGVEIGVAGLAVGSPGWSGMPPANGGIAPGSIGCSYLEGDFRRPDQDEACGAFNSGTYEGAFGAKRTR